MYSVQDWTALGNTSTGLPLAELFYQATSTVGGAFALTFMLWIALGPCMIGSQLSTGRVFWAFSRDEAMPFSKTWSKVNATLKMPFNAQLCVTAIVAALGCLYLGSSTAFNSLLGSAVTINNLAYLVPTLTNFVLQRKTMYHGAFHMGYVTGMIVNGITVCWLVFAIVFFSFPYYKPVTGKGIPTRNIRRLNYKRIANIKTAVNMNYTCVVVGGLLFLFTGWWFVVRKPYTARMLKARDENEALVAAGARG